jgi:hypothetical protein
MQPTYAGNTYIYKSAIVICRRNGLQDETKMSTITETQKYITFKIKGLFKNVRKVKPDHIEIFTSDEKAVEEYFRKRSQPKRVSTFDRPFY